MSGTRAGGLKVAKINKAKRGEDFYVRIGRMGGKAGTTGGFYVNRELASKCGKIGGTISRRTAVTSAVGKENMRRAQQLRREREMAGFSIDKTEFTEGFDQPTWKDKLFRRIK